jgi:hypothetical protein
MRSPFCVVVEPMSCTRTAQQLEFNGRTIFPLLSNPNGEQADAEAEKNEVEAKNDDPMNAGHDFRSSSMVENCSNAASRSATISVAMMPGAGRLALSSRASSFSQKMSRLALSRLVSSS